LLLSFKKEDSSFRQKRSKRLLRLCARGTLAPGWQWLYEAFDMTELLASHIMARAPDVLAALRQRGWMAATAESCTGGLIAAALTSIAGSSDVVDRGFVTYSNGAKTDMLGVPAPLIIEHGAVSEPVARAMAEGAVAKSAAHIAVSVTGIAGPDGGSAAKPVGLVWFGCALRGDAAHTVSHIFPGDRAAVRAAAVGVAFDLLLDAARRP
jgi:nicotinamide-nucleotide amidase